MTRTSVSSLAAGILSGFGRISSARRLKYLPGTRVGIKMSTAGQRSDSSSSQSRAPYCKQPNALKIPQLKTGFPKPRLPPPRTDLPLALFRHSTYNRTDVQSMAERFGKSSDEIVGLIMRLVELADSRGPSFTEIVDAIRRGEFYDKQSILQPTTC